MNDDHGPVLRGDRPYTIRVTLFGLAIGVPLAAAIGALFASLNQTPTSTAGQVNFSLYAFGIPLAFLLAIAVLGLSIFWLPVRLAKRAERVLDPQIYPLFGVISAAALLVIAFVLAMLLRII